MQHGVGVRSRNFFVDLPSQLNRANRPAFESHIRVAINNSIGQQEVEFLQQGFLIEKVYRFAPCSLLPLEFYLSGCPRNLLTIELLIAFVGEIDAEGYAVLAQNIFVPAQDI